MCDMDSYSSCSSEYADEGRALERLLDAFGPSFTVEDIASAYCKAGRNVHMAGEILYGLQENNPPRAATHSSNGESSGSKLPGNNAETSSQLKKNYKVPELLLDNNAADTSNHLQKNLKGSKPRKVSVSTGTVSSVLGKGYGPTPSIMNDLCKSTKPVKLELKEPLKDDTDVVASDFLPRNGPMNNNTDVEEFLFSMLGDGFHLGMDVIQDVLGSCGYDAKKCMNELLDLSTTALDKTKDTLGDVTEKHANKCFKVGSHSHSMDFAPRDEVTCTRNGAESSYLAKEKCDLPREVLESLFNVPDRPDDTPKKTRLVRAVKRRRAVGTVVTKPPPEIDVDHSPAIVEPPDPIENDEEEKYQILRTIAKKNWDIMKAYYEAAVDEFQKGNRTQASYLLEQGKFYNEKAREADEKSARKILEIRSVQVENELTVKLHDHDLKEAIRLLKFHLKSLANIPSIQFLKVIVESNAEDITKGARKRLVIKLLENESIEWKEEDGNPGKIIIRVDKIDAERLSFAKK
ncbi:silencing defective 5 isoform X2 [Tasmannia lanceolata]